MEHLTSQQIQDFQKRRLSSTESSAVAEHIQACDNCRTALMSDSQFQQGFESIQSQILTESHPGFEELAGYVDGLEEYSWIEEHLQGCNDCDMQVEDMREARKELPPLQFRGPSAVPTYRAGLLIAASLLLALLAAAWFYRNSLQKPEPQIVHPVPQPEQSRQLVLNDHGYRIELDPSGKVSPLQGVSSEDLAMLDQIVKSGKLPAPPDLKVLNPEGSVLLGEEHKALPFHVSHPVGVIVMSQRPEFRWESLKGASTYQVVITDRKLNVVAMSPEIRDTQWIPDQDLQRGVIYSWQVIAKKNGAEVTTPATPAPEALFQVLPLEQSERIESAIRQNAPGLIVAALMNQAGLTQEAAEHLHQLEIQNPGNPLLQRLQNP